MKRFICFLALLAWLSLSAFAVPKIDGKFHPREYDETLSVLQIPQHEANNNLSFAYLHWVASPADYSVYLGLQYNCKDYALEDGLTGVILYDDSHDERVTIGMIYADGTIEGVDHDRYELEGFLDDGIEAQNRVHDIFCEVRAGLKFWPDSDVYIGIQILDFSGNPSNYYRQLVYSPYTTTSDPDETSTTRKTTTQKATTQKSTTQKTTTVKTTTEKSTTLKTTTAQTTSTTAAETTARGAYTTLPVITAATRHEPTATTAATTLPQATVLQPIVLPAASSEASKAVKTKPAKTSTTKHTEMTEITVSQTTTAAPAAEAKPSETEPAEPETTAPETTAAAANVQMYREMNKVKIVGTMLVAVILTAAIMSSVFLGMRQKKEEPQKPTPQEEYDDFG